MLYAELYSLRKEKKFMKCKFCRNDVPDGAKICPTCGSVVEPENMSAAENQGEGNPNAE